MPLTVRVALCVLLGVCIAVAGAWLGARYGLGACY